MPSVVAGLAITSSSRERTLSLAAVASAVVLAPWLPYMLAIARNGEDVSAWLLVGAELMSIRFLGAGARVDARGARVNH